MWAIAGVLLGLVAVSAFAGFHLGPHVHAASTLFGSLAAVFLVVLALTGHAEPLLFALLAGDVAVTGGVAVVAGKGLATRRSLPPPTDVVAGAFGSAIDLLDPNGTVRLRGEVWSATALNPPIHPGTSIQVIRRDSVRLEVWGDTGHDPALLFSVDSPPLDETATTLVDPPGRPEESPLGEERTPSP
jgi:membrane protein implicated in regulation of membrane protease activity